VCNCFLVLGGEGGVSTVVPLQATAGVVRQTWEDQIKWTKKSTIHAIKKLKALNMGKDEM
jgi:hypothetical protein